jgi:hypothetical protein
MEEYRADIDGRGTHQLKTYLGGSYMLPNRRNAESVMGDFVALKQRADLRLKVQSRLQTLFGRDIELRWVQEGVEIEFLRPATGRSPYPGGQEASGLVQLVSLLAALYDNEVQCLLVDEPEVSLHPQLQSFLLGEIQFAAGDPSSGKKLIVLSTHSPSMLNLSRLEDLTSIVFFHDAAAPPTQISTTAPELESSALKGLIARMGMAHRIAFFAPVVVLVEGPSDEIIMNALASRLSISLGAAGVQIVPVTGKGEIPAVAKLFGLIGASVFVLSDLDGFTDGAAVVNIATASDEANAQARKQGHSSLRECVQKVKTQIDVELTSKWTEIFSLAEQHPYWLNRDPQADSTQAQRRAALATLFSRADDVAKTSGAEAWQGLRIQVTSLFDLLEVGRCFFLRRGTIENYFGVPRNAKSDQKPAVAASEADTFLESQPDELTCRYADLYRCLQSASRATVVDEVAFLRAVLGGILGASFVQMKADTTDEELNRFAAIATKDYAGLFRLQNTTKPGGEPAITVHLETPLFDGAPFPFEIDRDAAIGPALERKLSSRPRLS